MTMRISLTLTVLTLGLTIIAFSLAHTSPAAAAGEGEQCGTIAGITCDGDLWCEHETGACDAPDAAGVCIKTPGPCSAHIVQECGCDGKEYSRDCDRRKVRVQQKNDGACKM